MTTFRQHTPEEKRYQITLLRFGRATVTAKSLSEAIQKASRLNETEIQWLSETDGIPGGRLVSLVEPMEEAGPEDSCSTANMK